jgi:hypothetical protein
MQPLVRAGTSATDFRHDDRKARGGAVSASGRDPFRAICRILAEVPVLRALRLPPRVRVRRIICRIMPGFLKCARAQEGDGYKRRRYQHSHGLKERKRPQTTHSPSRLRLTEGCLLINTEWFSLAPTRGFRIRAALRKLPHFSPIPSLAIGCCCAVILITC